MSTLSVNPVMYLIVDRSVPMSPGKLAAQVAHAAVEAYKISPDDRLKHIWDECGKHYTKIVLETDNIWTTERYLRARGFDSEPIIDEGRTEFEGRLTATVLGVQIVDKNRADVQATFGQFKLYREPTPSVDVLTEYLDRWGHLIQPVEEPEEKRSFIAKLKERISAYGSRRDSGAS